MFPLRPFVAILSGFMRSKGIIIYVKAKPEVKRRFIWERLDDIQTDLILLRLAIEKMAIQTIVKQSELESIKYQVASLAESTIELENRVTVLEKHNSMERWIIRQVGTVALVVLIVFLVLQFL